MSKRCWMAILLLVFLASCQRSAPDETRLTDFETLSGPYFGQESPRATARIFMPGIISTFGRDGSIAFLDKGEFCVFTSDETGTRFTYLRDGHWTVPQQVPWGFRQGINDYTLGGDGKTFYWQSSKLTDQEDSERDINLWKSERSGVDWTEPSPLPEIVNHPEFDEIYPTAAAGGSVYYFCGDRPDSRRADIYVNRVEHGEYLPTERLPWPVNSAYGEFDFIVATDDSYLVFASDRPGGHGQCDNYVAFRRDDGEWTHPVNMGDEVNSHGNEIRSFVTHDKAYFFFGSTRESAVPKGEEFEAELAVKYGDFDVYWIDASILTELEEEVLAKECAAEIVRRELESSGLQAAVVRLKQLHATGRDRYLFSLFELLDICEQLIDIDREDEAEAFYAVLLEAFDVSRVQHGYAQILARHGNLERALFLLEDLEEKGEAIDLEAALTFLYYDLEALGRIDDAMSLLEKKIERFPGSYHSYCYLARLYEGKGEVQKAMVACERAMDINPEFAEAREMFDSLKARL